MGSLFNINTILNNIKDNEKVFNEILLILLTFTDIRNPEIFPRFVETTN